MLKSHEIFFYIDKGVLKKKIWDLSKLKELPEASLKSKMMDLSLMDFCVVGVPINMVSSKNWLWEAAGCRPCKGSPWREPSTIDAVIYCPKPSSMVMKRKWERERIPLTNAYRGWQSLGGYTIDKDEKERRGGKVKYLLDSIPIKTKSWEEGLHILPTKEIKIFGEININKHTWGLGRFKWVDHFMNQYDTVHYLAPIYVTWFLHGDNEREENL